MTQNTTNTPLEYQAPSAISDRPKRSAGAVILHVIGGLALGFPGGIGAVMGIGALLPQVSRAQTETQAGVVCLVGLGMGVSAFVMAGVWQRWFWAGVLGGAGLAFAGLGFLIGICSGNIC